MMPHDAMPHDTLPPSIMPHVLICLCNRSPCSLQQLIQTCVLSDRFMSEIVCEATQVCCALQVQPTGRTH